MVSGRAKRNLIIGYITVFMDVLGYSLITPILPFLSDSLGATDFEEGLSYSGYCLTQALSSIWYYSYKIGLYIMGNGSDYYGRKIFFILSLFGSCFGSIFQGLSTTVWQLIIWRLITGLFAGSPIITQALIADCTPVEERNKYLAILEAVISAASVLGPAIGSVLSQFGYSIPLHFAGIVAGIALIFALIYLEETNKDVYDLQQLKKELKKKDEQGEIRQAIELKQQEIKKSRQTIHVKPTKLMVLCFVIEFCNRWALNTINSRYGAFLLDKFNVTSTTFSYIMCGQSLWLCFQQGYLYSLVVHKLGCPIPHLALVGMLIEIVAYIFIAFAPTLTWSIVASTLLYIGFAFAVPTSNSIISTTNRPEIQGKVLSWNNMSSQGAFIFCPLILSSIYSFNREVAFYGSAIIPTISAICVLMMLQMPGARNFGKTGKHQLPVTDGHTNEVEMKDVHGNGLETKDIHANEVEMKDIHANGVEMKDIHTNQEQLKESPAEVVVQVDNTNPSV